MEQIKCGYEHCDKTFDYRKGKKYCSNACRARVSDSRLSSLGSTQTQNVRPQNFAAPQVRYNQPDPSSQYIINHLTEEKKRWETAYNEEKAKRQKLKDKNEELEKKILTIENENRISAIENAKPSGLNGILSTPAGEKLLEVCAPLIQRMLEPQPAAQMTGTDGHAQQTPAILFQGWFVKLSLPTQQTVWRMLQTLTVMPDAELKDYASKVIVAIQQEYPNQAVNQ